MKAIIVGLVASRILAGCALSPAGAPSSLADIAPAQASAAYTRSLSTGATGYTSALISENTHELKYSGPWLGSRDAVEGALLYRAALLARQRGSTWFRFLHMPGERGPLSHPSRPSASFGASYGHWQPHWSYLTDAGWQPWHPEWRDRFWAERLAPNAVRHAEAHAMIELRPGAVARDQQTDFEVSSVLRDLRAFK